MISTSADYKTEVWQNDNRQFLHYCSTTLLDGTVIELDNSTIWQGGFRLEEAVSSTSSMDVGSCIASQLTLIINNIDGSFDGTDFEGASVVASIGLMVNGSEERFQRGVYFVDEMEYSGSLITLTCLDAMVKFDKDYSLSTLTYPATLSQIVSNICSVCGVTLVSNTFPNSDYIVQKRPDDAALTCREVLSYALQIGCSYGHINPSGQLEISSYELGVGTTSTWNDIAPLTWDGLANFTWNALPYPTGDSFNGGTFWVDADNFDGGTFWTDEDDFDGGAFLNLPEMDFTLRGYSSFKVDFRRCTFTGVEVTVDDNSVLVGNDAYVLKVENNVLVNDPATVASLMRPYILGLTFWPYEAEHLSDPSLQAGDSVLIIDRKGNEYRTFATNISYSAGNYETTGCYAQSYPRNTSNRYSPAAVAEARAVSTTNKYIDLMANSFGLYRSEIPDPVIAGAYTYALHNASTYEASTFAMIANAEGLFMQSRASVSDEWTTTASVASDGDALVNVLTAIGIKAGWIKVGGSGADGTLYIYDTSDNVIGEWGADGIKIYEGAIDITSTDPEEDIISLSYTTTEGGTVAETTSKMTPASFRVATKNTTTSGGVTTVEETYCQLDPSAMEVMFKDNDSNTYTAVRAWSSGFVQCVSGTFSGGSYTPTRFTNVLATGIASSGIYNTTVSSGTANLLITGSNGGYSIQRIGSSSRRYKHDISELKDFDPHDLYKVDAKQYIFNDGYLSEDDPNVGKPMLGFIAEEVAKAAPWAVQYENGKPEMWSINTMFPALFQLVKEQKRKIDDLEERLSALEARYLDDGR